MSRIHTVMAGALLAFAVAAPLSASAQGQGLPQTLNMSCSEARGVVFHNGAALLATGPLVFNRYVRSMSYCEWGDVTKPMWVETRDTQQCPIGYICWEPNNEGGL